MLSNDFIHSTWMVFWGSEVGINIGMVVGTISVIVAAYLMFRMGWRDADDE